jgi:hypothetical protein
MLQGLVVELQHALEGLVGGQEGHFRATPAVGLADHAQGVDDVAVGELDEVLPAVAPDAQLQLARQGVDHRHADPMQAAGPCRRCPRPCC